MGELIDFMPIIAVIAQRRSPPGSDAALRAGTDRIRCRDRTPLRLRSTSPRDDLTDDGATFTAGETRLTLSLIREPDDERLAEYAAAYRRRRPANLPCSLKEGQMRGVVLETGARPCHARCVPVDEAQRLFDDTCPLLAGLGGSIHLCRTLARAARTLGDHPEAHDLCADGRPGGRAHGRSAGADRWRTQLGLPLHLGARRIVLRHDPPAHWASSRGCRPSAGGSATGSPSTRAASTGPLHIMYRIDGDPELVRRGPGGLGGLSRLVPGENRQRSGRSTAARHLRRGDSRRSGNLDSVGLGIGQPGWLAITRTARLARRQLGSAGGGHLGDPRRAQGLHLRAPDVLGGVRPRHPPRDGARSAGAPDAMDREARDAIYNQIMDKGWNAERRGLRAAIRRTRCSTPPC